MELSAILPQTMVILVGTVIAMLWRLVRSGGDLLDPSVPVALLFLLLFVVRPFYLIGFAGTPYYRGMNAWSSLSATLWIVASGVVTYWAVFLTVTRRCGVRTRRVAIVGWSSRRVVLGGLAYVIIGASLLGLYVWLNGGLGFLMLLLAGRSEALQLSLRFHSGYLFAAPLLLVAVAGVNVLIAQGKRGGSQVFLLALAVFLVMIPSSFFLLFGNRRFVLPSILIPVVLLWLCNARRPSWKAVIGMAGLGLVSVLVPLVRSAGARSEAGGLVPLIGELLDDGGRRLATVVAGGADTAVLESLALAVRELGKTVEFTWGQATVGDFLLAPVPSALVPGLPESARDKLLTAVFGGPCDAVGGVCEDFSAFGSFYQDFGVLGVVVGMGLMAWAIGLIWQRVHWTPTPGRVATASTAVVFIAIILKKGVMPGMQWFMYFWLPLYFLIHIAKVRYVVVSTDEPFTPLSHRGPES